VLPPRHDEAPKRRDHPPGRPLQLVLLVEALLPARERLPAPARPDVDRPAVGVEEGPLDLVAAPVVLRRPAVVAVVVAARLAVRSEEGRLDAPPTVVVPEGHAVQALAGQRRLSLGVKVGLGRAIPPVVVL